MFAGLSNLSGASVASVLSTMSTVLITMPIWLSERESVGALILKKAGHYHHKFQKFFSYGDVTDVQHVKAFVVEERGACKDARRQIEFTLRETGFEMVCEVFNYNWPVLMVQIQVLGADPVTKDLSRRLAIVEEKMLALELSSEKSQREATDRDSSLSDKIQMLENLVNEQRFDSIVARGEGTAEDILKRTRRQCWL